jgi:hypothetical protein
MPPSIVVVQMNQSSYERNGWSAQIATMSRPVYARASFSDDLEESLGALELVDRRAGEIRSDREGLPNGLDDRRVRVTEGHRPEAHAVLDELVAVRVPDVASRSAFDDPRSKRGELIFALRVRVGAPWNDLPEAAAHGLGAREIHDAASRRATGPTRRQSRGQRQARVDRVGSFC